MKIKKINHKNIINKVYKYVSKRNKIFRFMKIGLFTLENYKKTRSDLWSSSLTYFTLLSIVPVLAIAFSIAKGFGADQLIEDEILRNSPLQPEALEKLITFSERMMENAKGGIIAGAGMVFLTWSVMKIFTLIEKSFNEIWMVARGRTLVRKFTDYLAIVIIFPIVMLLSNGIVDNIQGHFIKEGSMLEIIVDVTPNIILALFFTMIYFIIPNTKVKIINAFIAGFFAMTLFVGTQTLVMKSQIFLLSYNKVYGSFSIVPIFIVWQKMVWFITLLGAHLSFILQNSYKFNHILNDENMSIKSKREALFGATYLLIENYELEEEPITVEELGKGLTISMGETSQIINILLKLEIAMEVSKEDEDRYFKLNKNINTFTLGEFIELFESHGYNLPVDNNKMKDVIKTFNHRYATKEWNVLMKKFNEEE